ncbi:MAG: ABC transporter ATP-binding protein [Granulosicoccus sp.]
MSDAQLVRLENLGVTFGQGEGQTEALQPTSLTISKGEFVALVGPSGCGKSTILRLVSELIKPTTGNIFFAGRELGSKPVRVGMAFQSASLLPWMSVRDNVMLPLKIVPPFKQSFRAKRHDEYRKRADSLLAQVGLEDFADKSPWQLSGGMMQRANLCRALIHDPDLLLLDEPFGALDQFTREELWQTLQDLWLERSPTVMLVTHDLREAAYLASRICVMSSRPGRIIDDRQVKFARPRSIDVSFEPAFVSLVKDLRNLIVHNPVARKSEAA